MTDPALYRKHLEALDRWLGEALEHSKRQGLALDGVLFHAGELVYYHADDQPVVFHPAPHFVRWTPLGGPDHCVLARPGRKPIVIRVAPRDYWYEHAALAPSYWQDSVELREVTGPEQIPALIGSLDRIAYVGSSPEAASRFGIDADRIEPLALLAVLDWHRATKTDHELALIAQASRRAADGHRVARKAFEAGASEREIHWAYLQATGHLEQELPFEAIVALDEKASVLHYQNKRGADDAPGKVFLLDAGASCDGYASDITRTWIRDGLEPVFEQLLMSVDELQRDLVAMVTPGRPYPEIHRAAQAALVRALADHGIIERDVDQAAAMSLARTFMPHGVGHHLGIQVHDIGGRQAGPDGGVVPPPEGDPWLRNTRRLEPGHVVTVEPGVYFVPMLLDELKQKPEGKLVDWSLVEKLIPCGGIRIEDDVVCTPSAPKDLTRPLLQGPRGV
ncbi:MAG: Xaa-Pro dipeptidase [Acidobacteriota bacterium]|nr:MAG: Xaa-Pro dipeptidase [Acidobacteriota bacterium]